MSKHHLIVSRRVLTFIGDRFGALTAVSSSTRCRSTRWGSFYIGSDGKAGFL